MPASPRYRSLDIWRGIACLGVVIYHIPERLYPALAASSEVPIARATLSLCQVGASGVAFFFVISGYCIAAAADSAGGDARSFGYRRLRRIAPPFWAALALTAVTAAALYRLGLSRWLSGPCWGLIPNAESLTVRQWVGNLGLCETWLARWAGPGRGAGLLLGPSWTLCYEAQFYAVAAILLAVRPRRFLAMATVLALFSMIVFATRRTAFGLTFDGTCFDGRWFTFALGMIVYRYATDRRGLALRWAPAVLAVLAITGFAAGVGKSLILHEAIVGSAFASALCLLHRFDSWATHPWLAPLRLCGTISYSLYLLHWPVGRIVMGIADDLGWLGTPIGGLVASGLAIATSILAAWAFHVSIERRFLATSHKKKSMSPDRSWAFAAHGPVSQEGKGSGTFVLDSLGSPGFGSPEYP